MSEEKKYEMKEPKENLHWISYNVKKQYETQKEMKVLLEKILQRLDSGKSAGTAQNEEVPF